MRRTTQVKFADRATSSVCWGVRGSRRCYCLRGRRSWGSSMPVPALAAKLAFALLVKLAHLLVAIFAVRTVLAASLREVLAHLLSTVRGSGGRRGRGRRRGRRRRRRRLGFRGRGRLHGGVARGVEILALSSELTRSLCKIFADLRMAVFAISPEFARTLGEVLARG